GFNEAFDQPPQTKGNRTAQANRFAFNNDAVSLLFEAPIRIQAPQKAAVVTDRFFHFGSGSGIFHFSDSCRETAAGLKPITVMPVNGPVIRVVVDGNHFLADETQENVERIAIAGEKLGFLNLFEIPVMLIVILDPVQQRIRAYSWDEYRAKPVVNHGVGRRHLTAIGS